MRYIGHLIQLVAQLSLQFLQLLAQLFGLLLEGRSLCFGSLSLLLLALTHQQADLFGDGLGLIEFLVELLLCIATCLVGGQNIFNMFFSLCKTSLIKACNDSFLFFFEYSKL